jgi:hypothetical protein
VRGRGREKEQPRKKKEGKLLQLPHQKQIKFMKTKHTKKQIKLNYIHMGT